MRNRRIPALAIAVCLSMLLCLAGCGHSPSSQDKAAAASQTIASKIAAVTKNPETAPKTTTAEQITTSAQQTEPAMDTAAESAAEASRQAVEASKQASEASRQAAEAAEAASREEESRKAAEEESRRAAEEESRRAAEEESRRAAEEESRRAAETEPPTTAPVRSQPDYIANISTKKFHYPWCHSVEQMKEQVVFLRRPAGTDQSGL